MSTVKTIKIPAKTVKTVEKTKKEIEKPKPGANAFHHFNYGMKLLMGDKYDYQIVLKKWDQMDESDKQQYKEEAADTPRHKKKPGALRNVSAYDVLRNELSEEDFKFKKELNKVQIASGLKKWIETNYSTAWGENGENWLITPKNDHIKIIKEGIKNLNWM